MDGWRRLGVAGLLLALVAAQAAPLVPASDDERVESLPARRAPPVAAPEQGAATDPVAAVREAGDLLAQAHADGDPRFAGRALARLQPWAADPRAPAPVVLKLAQVEQYIHRFDAAQARLQALLARDARQPQAWLTLATLQRLRGRYAESDAACAALGRLGSAALHAQACSAENLSLRGEVDTARRQFTALLAQAPDDGTRAWLSTSLGELEQRAGRSAAAERALRIAWRLDPQDRYAPLALADLLIDERRGAEALKVLDTQPRSDPVLLRRVAAGPRQGADQADLAELRDRFQQAAQRPGAFDGHAREQALYAWWVEGDLPAAVRHAQANLATQREPFDLLLLARVAAAAVDRAALAQAAQVQKAMDLHDQRLDRLLGQP
ncbi:tetratricopeptide repeat protein [Aquincola tertiaricarbonis]|uniref:Tetratricopeptide repeat protein n=1 Tax=Aquincola tertiaricarbonis TaxID=391953 RepID=A0ABY4SGI4_AQUTE|nr:tetratricopeptide repeat protein [Aquincola tertiaricarbonis]URI11237.1 tetratricopeptide repeat protein [Aquincola tertiaricarbonis]